LSEGGRYISVWNECRDVQARQVKSKTQIQEFRSLSLFVFRIERVLSLLLVIFLNKK